MRTASLIPLLTAPMWVAPLAGCIGHAASGPPIVAMLTDYGHRDAYSAVLAAAILLECPTAQLVTITHDVPAFDVAEGSYVLARAAREFPSRAVFVVVVDPGVGTARRSIVVRTETGHTFVGPDNGILTGAIHDLGLDGAWEITGESLPRAAALSHTFHGRDIYGPVGGRLAKGLPPHGVGPPIHDPILLPVREAILRDSGCVGQILHVDRFGNLMTNIPAAWAADRLETWGCAITIELNGQSFPAAWVRTYADVAEGDLLILANSQGRLEIACNRASAAVLLSARAGNEVQITF